jgi:hypothetical protein
VSSIGLLSVPPHQVEQTDSTGPESASWQLIWGTYP